MNFEELKVKLTETNNIDEVMETVEIMTYLPYSLQKLYIDDVMDLAIEENDNGTTVIDFLQLELAKNVYFCKYFTNLELSEDNIIEQYDYLNENEIFEYIYNYAQGSSLVKLQEALQSTLNQRVTLDNSLECVIAVSLNKLVDKIPNLTESQITKYVDKLAKSMKSFNPDSYKKLVDLFNFSKGEK